ncbi:MAG TPA: PAS domain-containing protein [Candidatus Limnocylindrales bacterium]|nr:PAS domain-containing protein [Candidatus Limnocylindrales bacterium]
MLTSRPHLATGILISILATAAAALLRYFLDPMLGTGAPFTIFLLAIVASAWFGGLWPGLLAAVLGAILGDFFFVEPRGEFTPFTTIHAVQLGSYFLLGTSISIVSQLWHLSRHRLERTVASLRLNQGLLQLAERTAGLGVWEIHDMESGDGRWSERCHRLYGTDPATFLPSRSRVLELIHADDRERVVGAGRESIETHCEYDVEFRVHHPDTGERWLWEVGSVEYGPTGHPLRMAGITVDATARKVAEERLRESEAQFRAIADFAPAKLWVTDASGRCTYLSPKWYAFSGRAPREDLGLGWQDLLHPEDRPRVEKTFSDASRGRTAFTMDVRFRRSDGQYRWMADAGTPRFDEAGHFIGYVGVVIDIHERKSFEQELKEADRRKDEFLATLAHELRNPLAPIRNGLHLMRLAERDAATVERARGMIDRQVAQMVRLIDDLLDVSRITSGKIELRREWINLRDAMQSAVETSRPLIDSLGHELVVTLPDEPILLDADLTRLAQSFANLLQNAAKYSEPGGRILVTARKEDGRAVVSVRDEGMGIPPELLPAVFDLFVQEPRSLGHAQGGLGIGLTLVKRLVELHGGSVEARSDGVGRGSEFVVTLPLVELPVVERPSRVSAENGTHGATGRRRVLVVDDNEDSVESLAMLLAYFGHDVEKASNGGAALKIAERCRPDTVLLDLGMPGMSGYDVCRAIRQEPWGAPITLIALTGWGQVEDRERTREAGFDHHMVKPVDPNVLQGLLHRPAARGPEEPAPV